jgi:hypothetical protein
MMSYVVFLCCLFVFAYGDLPKIAPAIDGNSQDFDEPDHEKESINEDNNEGKS